MIVLSLPATFTNNFTKSGLHMILYLGKGYRKPGLFLDAGAILDAFCKEMNVASPNGASKMALRALALKGVCDISTLFPNTESYYVTLT